MSFEPRIGPEGRDDDLTRGLRELYAPPADEAYWHALAQRIMVRIGRDGEQEGWWQPLAAWVRFGVAAAGFAITAAGVLMTQRQQTQTRIAYKTVIETPRTIPLQIATEHQGESDRDATLLYVISP